MKKILSLGVVVPLILSAGCAHEEKYAPVAVAPGDATAVEVPAPVSNRPETRVYPEGTVVVSSTQHQIAVAIQTMLNDDPAWKDQTDKVDVRVSGTTVQLTGDVANDSIRDQLVQKIQGVGGVTEVENGLTVLGTTSTP